MQSGVAVEFAERLFAEVLFDQSGQEGAPPGVQQPHAADMRGVVSCLNKLRQRALDQQVPAAVQLGVGGFQRLHQRRRQHHIAEAQRRVERFAEGADVNHRRVGLQPLQRRDRLAGKAEFAVVVVLDDPAAGVARQRQQPLAARRSSPSRADTGATGSRRSAAVGWSAAPAVPARLRPPPAGRCSAH